MSRIYEILCLLVILAVPVLLGGVHTQTVLGVGAVISAAALLYLASTSSSETEPVAVSIPSLAFFGFTIICVIQLLPLPNWLIELLSPRSAQHFTSGWTLLDGSAASAGELWRPLSLDPRATADRGLRWAGLGLAALLAVRLGHSRRKWTAVIRTIIVGGWLHVGLSALSTLGERGTLLGFYETQSNVWDYSLFINPNHAAAFYGLCCLAAIALTTRRYRAHPVEATIAAVSGVVFLALATTFESMATMLALVLALLLILGGFARQLWEGRAGADEDSRWTKLRIYLPFVLLFGGLAGVCVLWTSGALAGESLLSVFGASGATRIGLVLGGLEVATEYPALGTGAGSVERVISPYIDWSQVTPARIGMLENEPAEWAMTLGLLPALAGISLGLLSLAYVLYKAWTTSRQRYIILAAFALYMFVLVQFHFPFFTYGLAIPFLFLFESGLRAGNKSSAMEGNMQRRGIYLFVDRRLAWAIVAGTLSAIAIFATTWIGLSKVYGDEPIQTSWSSQRLQKAARYIPTESRIYTIAALKSLERSEAQQAVMLAEHAYRLEPRTKELLFLARILARAGRTEASVNRYQQLFASPFASQRWRARRWIAPPLLNDITDNHSRATALGPRPHLWERTLLEITNREGKAQAIDFAMALTEVYPEHGRAEEMLITQYFKDGQYQLAQMLAESHALAESLDDSVRARAYGWLVRSLLAQEQEARAWKVTGDALEQGLKDELLHEFILNRFPNDPRQADASRARVVARAWREYCHPLHEANSRMKLKCWRAEAWLDERNGELDDAEVVYQRILSVLKNPDPLGLFLTRQASCLELEHILNQWIRRSDSTPQLVKRLRRHSRQCARQSLDESP